MKNILLLCVISAFAYFIIDLVVFVDYYFEIQDLTLGKFDLRNLFGVFFNLSISLFFLNLYKKQ